MLRQPRFWLLNAVLLLLYVWTLTETATVTVAAGQCTAVFQEPFGTRPSQIACPGLGTATGDMPFDEAARQMALAYRHFLAPPQSISWHYAQERQLAVRYGGNIGL